MTCTFAYKQTSSLLKTAFYSLCTHQEVILQLENWENLHLCFNLKLKLNFTKSIFMLLVSLISVNFILLFTTIYHWMYRLKSYSILSLHAESNYLKLSYFCQSIAFDFSELVLKKWPAWEWDANIQIKLFKNKVLKLFCPKCRTLRFH